MTAIANRIIQIYQRRTSMRLTSIEWEAILEICKKEHIPRKMLFELIYLNHDDKMSLTASIRLFTIIYYKNLYSNPPNTKGSDDTLNPIFETIKKIV
jgi:predicted DNA-binding ribbon-helix-helix protein